MIYFILFYCVQILYVRWVVRKIIKWKGRWRTVSETLGIPYMPIVGMMVATIAFMSEMPTTRRDHTTGKFFMWLNNHDLKK